MGCPCRFPSVLSRVCGPLTGTPGPGPSLRSWLEKPAGSGPAGRLPPGQGSLQSPCLDLQAAPSPPPASPLLVKPLMAQIPALMFPTGIQDGVS